MIMMNLQTLNRIYVESGKILQDTDYLKQLSDVCVRQRAMYTDTGNQVPTRAVLVGLAHLSLSKAQAYGSCTQLRTFMHLLDAFNISPRNAKVHDPAFNDIDIAFVRSVGLDVPKNSIEAMDQLICREPTLVFMPFLPFPVIELVLYQNWQPELLKNLNLVCNEWDGWLNNGRWRKQILEGDKKSENWAFIPRIDRTLSLLERDSLPALDLDKAAKKKAEDPFGRMKLNFGLHHEEQILPGFGSFNHWPFFPIIPDDNFPLLERKIKKLTALEHGFPPPAAGAKGKGPLDEMKNSLLNFTFLWMPVHRIYALGDSFWKILPELEGQHAGDQQVEPGKKQENQRAKL